MKNRYLFRAKRTDNGEWVEGYHAVVDNNAIIIRPSENYFTESLEKRNGSEIIKVDPSTVCQCTGLKDKNGKLIWENDIVDGRIRRGVAFYRCIVLWNECKARFDVRAMDCNFPMTLDECTDGVSVTGFDYEVVGNIFDNPYAGYPCICPLE